MSRYAVHNMNKRTHKLLDKLSSTVSETFETLAFLIIGISVFGFSYPIQKIGVLTIAVNFVILLFARFVNIYVTSFFINACRIKRINGGFKAVMWLSGLRGAMAFAIAITNSNNKYGYVFLSMTILFSVVTIYLFGGAIPFAMRWLKVDKLDPDFDVQRGTSKLGKRAMARERQIYDFFANQRSEKRGSQAEVN